MCLNRLGSLEIPGAVPGPPGQNGQNGSQGPEGPAGVGWITGQGIPPNNLTTYPDGTLYLDTLLGNVFEYNASTLAWDLVASIAGPQGNTGPAGPQGVTNGTGVLTRNVIANQNLTSAGQQLVLGTFSIAGNTLLSNTGSMVKLCSSTKVFSPTQPGSPYGHIITININGVALTNNSDLTFIPQTNSLLALAKACEVIVEASIFRDTIGPFAPTALVKWSTSYGQSGFFTYSAASSIDFSVGTTVNFGLESISTSGAVTTRVGSSVWIERYFKV